MEINQERLDELKAEFAYRQQMPIEEVSRMMDNLIIGFRGMAEWLEPFAKEMVRRWRSFKESIKENRREEIRNAENEAMHGWDLKWDTRKLSQVSNRKPRYLIKKIIR